MHRTVISVAVIGLFRIFVGYKMNILLIISGSVAAYKSLEVIRELKRRKHNLQCVLSKCGEKFITPMCVSSLSGNYTYSAEDTFSPHDSMKHITLSRKSDLVLVAPATANLVAKIAHGICDDLPTSIILASTAPIVVAPVMNSVMLQSPAMSRNLEILRNDGVHIIDPEFGELACGEEGYGKMPHTDTIVSFVEKLLLP